MDVRVGEAGRYGRARVLDDFCVRHSCAEIVEITNCTHTTAVQQHGIAGHPIAQCVQPFSGKNPGLLGGNRAHRLVASASYTKRESSAISTSASLSKLQRRS